MTTQVSPRRTCRHGVRRRATASKGTRVSLARPERCCSSLLAVEGVTILDLHDLLSVHVFVGMLVATLVVLKLASTGYRFVRYYTGDPNYLRKGAPQIVLRVVGPIVVVSTIAVVASGIVLVLAGPSSRDPLLGIHKASFIVWFVVMTVHVVGHVRDTIELSVADVSRDREQRVAGRGARLALVAFASAAGSRDRPDRPQLDRNLASLSPLDADENDYRAFCDAIRSGGLEAREGV